MKINPIIILLICTFSTSGCAALQVFVDSELDAQRADPPLIYEEVEFEEPEKDGGAH